MAKKKKRSLLAFLKNNPELQFAFTFTVGYLLVFSGLAIWNKNLEFLYYTAILWVILFIIVLYYQKLYLDKYVFIGLTFLGAFHLLGGNIIIKGTRLYDLYLIPEIFKYDNFVHAFGIFIVTFAVYSLLRPILDDRFERNGFLLSLLLISIAFGIGAFNEVLELVGVLFFGAAEGVGDYYNNAFDLVFNLVGAVAASILIVNFDKKDTKK